MKNAPAGDHFDAIVIGAGPAGVTAAAALGRAGFSVLVCEAAIFPGAENWSGAVYFTENLEHEEAFGREAVEAAPYERRLIERGAFLYNGHTLLGATVRGASVYNSCYTVLRPVYDRYLAEVAREHGVVLACETTVQSLIRHRGRVIGVHTERGPAYADVVFLAEGDASHLVTQEGYERVSPEEQAHGAPHFLQGVKEVISLPADEIDRRFGLGEGEGHGAAYEMLLRNATRNGRTARLNMGGFLYTNADSISLGFVLPLDNLKENFQGDHNLLMEWFKALPEIAKLIDGGTVSSYGAKIIRGGGLREVPRIVDDGLAIGGAASGIGLDFPYPNFTGPATAMGLYFARAVQAIAAENGGPRSRGGGGGGLDPAASPYTAAALQRTYLKELHASHYYRNVEYLKDWPGYVERTQMFFERQLDVINNSAFVLSRRNRSGVRRWWQLVRLLRRALPWRKRKPILADVADLSRTIGVAGLVRAAVTPRNLASAFINTLAAFFPDRRRSAVGSSACGEPLAGTVRPGTGISEAIDAQGARLRAMFRVMGGDEEAGRVPWLFGWYWRRFGPALAEAFSTIYRNDDRDVGDKLRTAARLFAAQVAIWDLLAAAALGVGLLLTVVVQWLVEMVQFGVLKWDRSAYRRQFANQLVEENLERIRLDDDTVRHTTSYEERLGTISYREGHHSHIKVLWPEPIGARAKLADSVLWNVCPAKVYEVRRNSAGMPGVVVNFENCIKCEACWRATGDVHWSRATPHRLVYQTYSPAQRMLHDYLVQRPEPQARVPVDSASLSTSTSTSTSTSPHWTRNWSPLASQARSEAPAARRLPLQAVRACVERSAASLEAYGDALAAAPLTLEPSGRAQLSGLLDAARAAFAEAREAWRDDSLASERELAGEAAITLWDDATERFDELRGHAEQGRPFWAEVLGKQLREHHFVGLHALLDTFESVGASSSTEFLEAADDAPYGSAASPAVQRIERWRWSQAWREIEAQPMRLAGRRKTLRADCESLFGSQAVRALEHGEAPTEAQREWLRQNVAEAERAGREPGGTGEPATPAFGFRDVLLEELARADPAIAWLAASHLQALDLMNKSEGASPSLGDGGKWAACAHQGWLRVESSTVTTLHGELNFVPLALASRLVAVHDKKAYLVDLEQPGPRLEVRDVGTIGLMGAGIRQVRFDGYEVEAADVIALPSLEAGCDPRAAQQPVAGEPAADLIGVALRDMLAIVRGAGEYLLGRARDHASGRVQFPGTFEDEAGRDTIAKFGAVKQLLAEMEAQRYLVEALTLHNPATGSRCSGAPAAKVLAAEAFGPALGSFSYNAGQIFGGTAFSEDDVIAKYYRDSSPFRFLIAHDDALRVQVGRDRLLAVEDGERLVPLSDAELWWLELGAAQPLFAITVERFREAVEIVETWAAGVDASAIARAIAAATVRGKGELEEPLQQLVGGAVVRILGAKACLLRALWRLDAGLPAEATLEAAKLWVERLAAEVPNLPDEAALLAETVAIGEELLDQGELRAANIASAERYDVICTEDREYRSGAWLVEPFDPDHLRYVPEVLYNDPGLSSYWKELEGELRARFVEPSFEGLSYNRYLEKLHRIPQVDLDYMVERGFMRMPIPKRLGGGGALKAEYYVLCKLIGRYGDAALSLAIMANTSIGTTPVLIGMEQDLPRARAELEKVRSSPELLGDIRDGVDRLIAAMRRPNLVQLTADYTELMGMVRKRVVKSTVLKYLGGGFLRAFFAAGRAGQRRDIDGFEAHLREARDLLGDIVDGAANRLAEYPRRELAHEQFLQFISAGYISAFALTEPTAGSDSGGVKTFARLESRRVHRDDDGSLHFFVDEDGQSDRRNLVDAERLEFDYDDHRILYRYSDEADPAVIDHSDYDYDKDAPDRMRFYMHGDRRVDFTDIAQLRQVEGQLTYEFWVLNGSKMWITNGRFSHCMALYARTEPEGVTGFMVDRHAEGLVVGADEEKLGQRGSPTNELSFNNVRVPREGIIGFRGRGQVNALETLNTGRAGLAVTTHATIQEMVEDARELLLSRKSQVEGVGEADRLEHGDSDRTGPADARPLDLYWMGRVADELMATAGTTYELVGLLDNKHTESVRMESAIGKYYGSEAEHDVIDWMERLRGLEGQTHLHRIEKTRRDARVLNIYEGTNEVQRFLLLKDLVQRVLPSWDEAADAGNQAASSGVDEPPSLDDAADLVAALERAKSTLRELLVEAIRRFDQQIWANVGLQPCMFRLPEIAGLTKVIDAVLYRLSWCVRHQVEAEHRQCVERAARVFVRRALARIATLERRYRSSFEYLERNARPPELQLGYLSLEEHGTRTEGWGLMPKRLVPGPIHAPLAAPVRIAVLLKPVPMPAPRPRVDNAGFAEPMYTLSAADRAGLAEALRLKSRDAARVEVVAYAVAGTPATTLLREALALGVDRAVSIEPGETADGVGDGNGAAPFGDPAAVAHDPRFIADALAAALRLEPVDLVLCGDHAADTEQGLLAPYLATLLGSSVHAQVETVGWSSGGEPSLEVSRSGWQGSALKQALPAVLGMAGDAGSELQYRLPALLRASTAEIETLLMRALVPDAESAHVIHRLRVSSLNRSNGDAVAGGLATTPEQAAAVVQRVVAQVGGGSSSEVVSPYGGRLLSFGEQPTDTDPSCIYVGEPSLGGVLWQGARPELHAAAQLADGVGLPLDLVLPIDGAEEAAAAIAGGAAAIAEPRRIYVVAADGMASFGAAGHVEWLEELWAMYRGSPQWLVGTSWMNELFSRLMASAPPGAGRRQSWSWFNVESIANDPLSAGSGAASGPNASAAGRGVQLATPIYGGAAAAAVSLPPQQREGLRVVTLGRSVQVDLGRASYAMPGSADSQVFYWSPRLDYCVADDPVATLLSRLGAGDTSIADAEVIIDFGYGAGGRDGIDQLAEPLRKLLADELGLPGVMIGATRKVTQDLELLPMDRQIGQTGFAVNPRLIIALAVSGAPQHVDYIGERATILSFNIDPAAPLMRLNEQRARPLVHPIVGDVWETVPRFIAAIRAHLSSGR